MLRLQAPGEEYRVPTSCSSWKPPVFFGPWNPLHSQPLPPGTHVISKSNPSTPSDAPHPRWALWAQADNTPQLSRSRTSWAPSLRPCDGTGSQAAPSDLGCLGSAITLPRLSTENQRGQNVRTIWNLGSLTQESGGGGGKSDQT